MRTTLPRASSAATAAAGIAAVAALLANTPLAGLLVGDRDNLAPEPVVLTPVAWRVPNFGTQPQPAPAPSDTPREAVVVMGDGTRYTGLLVSQDDQHVVIEVGGIDLRLRAAEVSRIDILPPVRERYARLRAATADDDIPARLNLVNWLVGRGQYDLASEELTGIMDVEPRHPRALELRRVIDAARLLNASAENLGDQPDDPSDPDEIGDSDRRSKDPVEVLSAEEINLIRVYELDLERLPRIIIRRETVERLIEENAGDPLIPSTIEGRDDLLRAARSNPRRVLELIFRLKARHLYPEIQVIDNPRALQMFRERVHSTWLINACATCHNQDADAPRGPRLVTRRPNSDATVYSNFLILDRYRLADGTALIDYDDPAASALLQMGMPRVTAERAHPDVAAARGWSPVFLSINTNSYQHSLLWIRSMYRPRPEYPIDYPPTLGEDPLPAEPPIER